MSRIQTNNSAIVALADLESVNYNLQKKQGEISRKSSPRDGTMLGLGDLQSDGSDVKGFGPRSLASVNPIRRRRKRRETVKSVTT